MDKFVSFDFVDIIDEEVFTKEKVDEWKAHIMNSYEEVYESLRKKIDPSSNISMYINISLLRETLIDAIIGMKKIVDSSNNNVESPNAFKIAAYLSYWWLRHKPVCVHLLGGQYVENVQIIEKDEWDDEQKKEEQMNLAWEINHINELVAVQMVFSYIFDFSKPLCKQKHCEKIKKEDDVSFCFDSFESMKKEMMWKLVYYFSYRAISPKVIEHILEAYTFHPAWCLTGEHWLTKEKSGDV